MLKIIKTILSLFAIVFISYFIVQFVNTPAKNFAEKARDFAISQKIKLAMLKDSASKNLDFENLFKYFKETDKLSNPQNRVSLKNQILEKALAHKERESDKKDSFPKQTNTKENKAEIQESQDINNKKNRDKEIIKSMISASLRELEKNKKQISSENKDELLKTIDKIKEEFKIQENYNFKDPEIESAYFLQKALEAVQKGENPEIYISRIKDPEFKKILNILAPKYGKSSTLDEIIELSRKLKEAAQNKNVFEAKKYFKELQKIISNLGS